MSEGVAFASSVESAMAQKALLLALVGTVIAVLVFHNQSVIDYFPKFCLWLKLILALTLILISESQVWIILPICFIIVVISIGS